MGKRYVSVLAMVRDTMDERFVDAFEYDMRKRAMPKSYRQQWRIVGWVHWLWFKCGFKAHAELDWSRMWSMKMQQENDQAIKNLRGTTEQLNDIMDRILAAHFRQGGSH